ncbi:acetyl-CoA acetyltransferase [Emiliania huxleyi CCMP1516]|uniref:acetyl-CoA C-acetyltransferase n=2 Tax=Emiliania huxleyi TaxID=2903 RepID=A0A0D3KPW1_EMIH1|nr:acetyl-CoA acetyltransferase [Emiliania huxleyi CCMP1516]EOD37796.1 acetyl-CoA acetyltransferase [Emiliania huxleyi CCMP1516]|eukprot:XP_005790225.1 acetyl-CoA acetyltransferase [Emiliania huxleyi CCMP1516]
MRVFRQSARRLSSAAKSPRDAVIVGVARTPVGGFNGSLAALKAPELGSAAISAALDRAGVPKESVEQCWMGNVIASGMGQAPARQAAQMAGLPDSTCCTTVNKVCSSGMKAVTLGSQEIVLGNADVLVAGGMESMSNVPYYLPKARFGARMGDATMVDGLVFDGLWDPYDNCHMGGHAELCAETHGITREMQDAHAREPFHRPGPSFGDEIAPVTVKSRKGDVIVTADDECAPEPRPASAAKPAFKKKDGTVTAANASTISDGSRDTSETLPRHFLAANASTISDGSPTLSSLSALSADAEQEPCWFTTAPAAAIPKALARAGLAVLDAGCAPLLAISDVDFFEINEAFSVVSVANNQLLGLDPTRVNVRGGAVSIGHPIGASGARIVVTLLSVLREKGGKIGVAGICNGGGGASAIVIEAE